LLKLSDKKINSNPSIELPYNIKLDSSYFIEAIKRLLMPVKNHNVASIKEAFDVSCLPSNMFYSVEFFIHKLEES